MRLDAIFGVERTIIADRTTHDVGEGTGYGPRILGLKVLSVWAVYYSFSAATAAVPLESAVSAGPRIYRLSNPTKREKQPQRNTLDVFQNRAPAKVECN